MPRWLLLFIQYGLYGVFALLTLLVSIKIKEWGYKSGYFDTVALSGDGVLLWLCLMLGVSVSITKLFRTLFGREKSIL